MQEETKQAAIKHALSVYPEESCGLVAIIKGKEVYRPCFNRAKTKSEHFIISGEQWAEIEDEGEITAVIHSHPDWASTPSQVDKVQCELTGLPWHILSIGRDPHNEPHFHDMSSITPSGYEAPLVGREFAHGSLDCFGLVRDYYKRVMGIELTNYERTDGWWERGENLYLKNLEDEGFYEVKEKDIRTGDMIVMQVRANEPNHAGVYLGDGLFLHHLYGRLSSRDVYGGFWREATRVIVRHKDAK
ncbi:C40 family peptidase [Stenotrophomonas phage BUCTxx99]|nr:C40 family peptidase [Stenotrophomonas phage BUCTxx99]